ncbi:hypothetical protein EON65_13220 [archaeon]|nr:MAG: hypothetical protein EON65_13220 [archaeon]
MYSCLTTEQLNVGVGALAGSTIMLLTVPWFLSILGGRVNIDPNTKLANYKAPKLTPPNRMHLTDTGVSVSPAVNKGAYVVLLTAVSYFLLQVPGLIYLNNTPEEQAQGEKLWAQLGFVVCLVLFVGYLYQQYQISRADITQKRTREQYLRNAILNRKITLTGVMIAELAEYNLISPHYASKQATEESHLMRRKSTHVGNVEIPTEFIEHLERILKPFFKIFDEDDNNQLSTQELVAVFREMGENPTPEELERIFSEFDTDKSGSIEYREFIQGVAKYIVEHRDVRLRHMNRNNRSHSHGSSAEAHRALKESEEEEEEEEDMPEDIQGLTPEEQQSKIKLKAAYMMGLGTIIVLIVSDPMVEVLSELGRRTGIPAFYIAFVLAPLASNASELIAAYNYSLKKTPTSISISMATLEGAAVMNNTFVLGKYTIYLVCSFVAMCVLVCCFF